MPASHQRGPRVSRGLGVLLALSLLAGVGCPYAASFRQGSLGRIRGWPPAHESRFSIVRPGEAADVLAKITISKKRESDYGGAVIDIFFGLIPIHHSTTSYESTTSFRTGDGEPLTISQSEQSKTWSHLVLIPLFPFMNPWTVERRILYDLARQTILAAQETGAFSK